MISDRQGKIEESVRSIESKALGSLNRIEARLAANVPEIKPNIVEITPGPTKTVGLAPDNLAPEEIDLIRQYLKVPRTDQPLAAKIGDSASDLKFPYLPDAIVRKIPRLKGHRYAYDQSGAILILAGGRVAEIIEAT